MTSRIVHVWKKDMRAAAIVWLLYALLVGGCELLLVTVYVPERGLLFQIPCWLFGLWMFRDRLLEDGPNRWDRRWSASRPLTLGEITQAKLLFLWVQLLGPFFVCRIGTSLMMGFSPVSALLSALASLSIPMIWAYILMFRAQYTLEPRQHIVFLSVLCFSAILPGLRFPPSHETKDLPLLALSEAENAPHPSHLIDPWFYTRFEEEQMIVMSQIERRLHLEHDVYKRRGEITRHRSSDVWFWYVHRTYPDRDVRAHLKLNPHITGGTSKRYVEIHEGKKKAGFRTASLPHTAQGTRQTWKGDLTLRIGEVSQVWRGPLKIGAPTVSDHIHGTVEQSEAGPIQIQLRGSTYSFSLREHHFKNRFHLKPAAVLVESGPDSPLLVLEGQVTTFDMGFPHAARRYNVSIPDPRPYFPADATLELTVLGATLDGRISRKEFPEILIMDPHREHLLAESMHGDHLARRVQTRSMVESVPPPPSTPDSPSQPVVNPLPSVGTPSEFARRLDRVLSDRLVLALSDPRQSLPSYQNKLSSVRELYRPEEADHVNTLLHRVSFHPYLISWLPEKRQEDGWEQLLTSMSEPPVLNPMASMQLAAEYPDRTVPNLGWCFEFSNRLSRMFRGINPQFRCPVHYLDLVPATEQDEVWERTWRRVVNEESISKDPVTPPDYFVEALTRESPNAVEAACIYLRKDPAKVFQEKRWDTLYLGDAYLQDLQRLIGALRSRFPHPGSDEEFLEWFRREGFVLAETQAAPANPERIAPERTR